MTASKHRLFFMASSFPLCSAVIFCEVTHGMPAGILDAALLLDLCSFTFMVCKTSSGIPITMMVAAVAVLGKSNMHAPSASSERTS
jgi:hypothetical protein